MVRKTILTALFFVFVIPTLAFAHVGKGIWRMCGSLQRGVPNARCTGPIRALARRAAFSMWRQ